MALFYCDTIPESAYFTLSEEESKHCLKTLRMRPGDHIDVTDGKGTLLECLIIDSAQNVCRLEILQKNTPPEKKKPCIHIASALTKNAGRMEFFIEKAVESGLTAFSPIVCKHSERTHFNAHRFHKIAVSAMKQSRQLFLPKINSPVTFDNFIKSFQIFEGQKFIAHQSDNTPHLFSAAEKGKDTLILVGPEGDFAKEEIASAIQMGFSIINLGANRLRTETAALFACFAMVCKNA